MTWHVRVIPNRYADSVRLMSIARSVRARDGVARCEVGMGTPANLELLAGLGAVVDAAPGDLVIAVNGHDAATDAALAHAERELSAPEHEAGPASARSGRARWRWPRASSTAPTWR